MKTNINININININSSFFMELNRGLLKAVIILLFVQFGLGRRMGLGLSSRTEWRTLLELRSSLGISGKDWVKKAEPCFHWTGVQCENGRVVGINLTGLSRTRAGRLQTRFAVDSLANLTLLGSFCASGFSLNGSIHEWLGQSLRKLEKLDLRSCWLTGPIPGSLGGLNGLKTLILSDNSLTGRMPSELGRLSGLSVLDLSNNSLTGPVPNSFSFLVNLTRLDLSSNFLSGSIPPHLGALSNLQILNLSDNGLTASVPPQLGNLYNLVKLDLSKNSLSGSLPDLLFSKIQMLILSENAFDGALPATLFSGPNLHFLDVSNNTLTGPLPKLTSSSNVNYAGATFNLSNNLFYGPLITMPSKFKTIDLSGNYFQGEVHVGRFKFSTSFTLDRNCLRMIPNQRDLEDCRVFYVERALPFSPGVKEPTQSPLLDSESGNNKREIFILAGIFGGLGFIVLLVLVLMLMLLLKQCSGHNSIGIQRGTANVGPVPEVENPTPPKDPVFVAGTGESFSYEQMLHLTANFAEENLIKHGHSGDLFWGTLEGGVTAVVKKVDLNLFKKESYMVELGLLLSKVSHARLVPLLGHCLENEHEKFLIYKYMPNGDFATSLHRVTCSDDKFKSMDWITRLKIAIGAAEGLSYLHECSPPLVHRDVQASSILLDDKFEVRLGSLSEVTAQGDLHQSVITRIFRKSSSLDQGNSGSSLDSCPYDVYCFGKVLLELITGNLGVSKSDDAATKEWLEQTLSYISIYDKEQVTRIVDPSLIVDDDLLEEVWAMAIVARSCLNPKPSKRPPMRYVLKALENPVKLVREENYSSARLRTTSSRRSWSFAFLGSWRQSSSESATATVHTNTEGASGFRQSGRVSSQGSGGNDHSFSQKISSNEIFPEPLEMQEMERQDEH